MKNLSKSKLSLKYYQSSYRHSKNKTSTTSYFIVNSQILQIFSAEKVPKRKKKKFKKSPSRRWYSAEITQHNHFINARLPFIFLLVLFKMRMCVMASKFELCLRQREPTQNRPTKSKQKIFKIA